MQLAEIMGEDRFRENKGRAALRVASLPRAHRTIPAIHDDLENTANTAANVIGVRILPAAMELMDNTVINVVEDAAAPLSMVPEMVDGIKAMGERNGPRIGILAHVGDCDMHPLITADIRNNEKSKRP